MIDEGTPSTDYLSHCQFPAEWIHDLTATFPPFPLTLPFPHAPTTPTADKFFAVNDGLNSRFPKHLRFSFEEYRAGEIKEIMRLQIERSAWQLCDRCDPFDAIYSRLIRIEQLNHQVDAEVSSSRGHGGRGSSAEAGTVRLNGREAKSLVGKAKQTHALLEQWYYVRPSDTQNVLHRLDFELGVR